MNIKSVTFREGRGLEGGNQRGHGSEANVGRRRRPAVIGRKRRKEILRRIASGETLGTICGPEDMPSHVTVLRLVLNDPDFQSEFQRARAARVEMLLDEIRQIAENGRNDWMARNDPDNAGYRANGECVQRSNIRIEVRKWLAVKMAPDRYGRDAEPETEEMMPAAPFKKIFMDAVAMGRSLPVRPSVLGNP